MLCNRSFLRDHTWQSRMFSMKQVVSALLIVRVPAVSLFGGNLIKL